MLASPSPFATFSDSALSGGEIMASPSPFATFSDSASGASTISPASARATSSTLSRTSDRAHTSTHEPVSPASAHERTRAIGKNSTLTS
jgi:hypothetical protein